MKITSRQLQCAKMFCALGYIPSGASSIVGNLSWESGGANLPTAFRTKNLDHGSNGMPQWRLERLDAYMAFVKEQQPGATEEELWQHYGRMDYQVRYIDIELKRDYPQLHYKLKEGGPVAALTADFTWTYERPSKQYAHLAERIAFAKEIFRAINPEAAPVSAFNAIEMDARTHDAQAQGATGVAVAGGLSAGAIIVQHVAPDMSILEWSALGVAALVMVGAVIALVTAMHKATQVRQAKIGLDPMLPPKQLVDAPKPPAPAPLAETPPAPKPKVDVAAQERAGMDAILSDMKSLKPSPSQAAEPAPVAEPVPPTPAEPTYSMKV